MYEGIVLIFDWGNIKGWSGTGKCINQTGPTKPTSSRTKIFATVNHSMIVISESNLFGFRILDDTCLISDVY